MLIAPFTSDPVVMAICAQYLRVLSWNFIGNGLIMTCSGMFQALGDTRPSFLASASRLLTFVRAGGVAGWVNPGHGCLISGGCQSARPRCNW